MLLLIDRRTATRCRSAAISVCDSSSTKDPEIVTSNSTPAIKNIAANTARLPSHAGLFFSLLLLAFLIQTEKKKTDNNTNLSRWVMDVIRPTKNLLKSRRDRFNFSKSYFFFCVLVLDQFWHLTDYSSSTIAFFHSYLNLFYVSSFHYIGNWFYISSKRFVKILIYFNIE